MKPTIEWIGGEDGHLALLDQTRLPAEEVVLELRDLKGVIAAIKRLSVRGAPAIGVAAGYGMLVGINERRPEGDAAFSAAAHAVAAELSAARPTATNLRWAAERVRDRALREPTRAAVLDEAQAIHAEDIELCRAMGAAGAHLIADGATVLTHCNAGRLATAGDGTALAVMFAAWRDGRRFQVIADETRPLLQGARLTALELSAEGIPVDVIADSAAAGLIARGEVDLIITGADRIAANGDVANKVGTYGLALAAQAHDVPMYVAAPTSTFDLDTPDGKGIVIEDRAADDAGREEVLSVEGHRIAPQNPRVGARNPAFDITPRELLAGLITDRGLIVPVTTERIKDVIGGGR